MTKNPVVSGPSDVVQNIPFAKYERVCMHAPPNPAWICRHLARGGMLEEDGAGTEHSSLTVDCNLLEKPGSFHRHRLVDTTFCRQNGDFDLLLLLDFRSK
jgi:hypothetical protein